MADVAKAEDVVENVAHGETEVKDPTTTNGEVTEKKADAEEATKQSEESKDAAEEKNGDATKNGTAEDDTRTHSSDHKRKDTNDHYRNDNKRSRGGGRGGRGGRGGGRGGSYSNNKNNEYKKNPDIKADFGNLEESNDPVEIRRQVEFYFSDSNLPVDGFLLGLVGGSKNEPVDLKAIHSFKRMRHFQPFSAVVAAVKESKVLDVEEKDNTAWVTRKKPLSDKFGGDTSENKRLLTSETMERSIYAKGFGEEGRTTHLDIESFFEPYGPINSIRLRRTDTGQFKGSVFVEFGDVETQKRFLDMENKLTWGEGEDEKELQIMSKQAYVDKKHEAIHEGSVRPRSPQRSFYSGRGRGRDRGYSKRGGGGRDNVNGGYKGKRYSDRGDRDRSRSPGDRDDWNKRRERDQRNGNRDDRKRGGRGRGRGGRDRDDRGRGRRDDGSEEERSRSRSPPRKSKGEENEEILNRAEAEVKKAEQSEGGTEKEGKKRAREENDEGGEAKKVKGEDRGHEVEVEA